MESVKILMFVNIYTHDPRLRQLVGLSGDATLFEDINVPYFTRRNWAREGRKKNMTTTELLDSDKAKLIIRITKLTFACTALASQNQLLKIKIEVFGIHTEWQRLPESGKKKMLAAIESARDVISLKECLKTAKITGARFHNWVRRKKECQLEDYNTCPKSSPSKLTAVKC